MNALIQSIPAILNVMVVCLVFWLIFAIMGVQFFGGKYFKCKANGTVLSRELVRNMNECLALHATDPSVEWVNSDINFDNVGNNT